MNQNGEKCSRKEDSNDFEYTDAGYYYELFKFFSDNHNLILLDSEIQEIIRAVEKFSNHPVRKIINDTWDGRCRCGHLHSEHRASNSINYSAGRCSVGECRCANFIIEK
jgi:hypothetical protein